MATLVALATLNVQAQSTLSTASFNKQHEAAVILSLPYGEDATVKGVENRMYPYGKAKKVKGYNMYRSVKLEGLGDSSLTLYISVDKKDKNNSTITLLLANDFDRFYHHQHHAALFARVQEFVNGFVAPVKAADLEMQIAEQQKVWDKQDKRVKKLLDEAADLEKQKKKLEEKITSNAAEQQTETENLKKEKELLEQLIKQRQN